MVSRNPSMILKRQTCGQRSDMAAGSKRWALAFYFFVRICYIFLMSKSRGVSDQILVFAWHRDLQKECGCAMANLKTFFGCSFRLNSPLRSGILFAISDVMQRPRSDSLATFRHREHVANPEIYNVSARRLLSASMPERWPQVYRIKITFRLLPNNWFVSTKTQLMKCCVN